MVDRNSIKLINKTTRTRRIAFALILLALALPSLFAWSDNVALDSASAFTVNQRANLTTQQRPILTRVLR